MASDPATKVATKIGTVPTAAYVAGFVALLGLAGLGGSPVPRAPRRAFAAASVSASASPAAPASSVAAAASSAPLASAPLPASPPRLVIDATSRVLVFGDSMTDAGFSQRLAVLVKARGGFIHNDAWTSATTTTWAQGDRLQKLLAWVKPTVAFVVLGANEVFLPRPEELAPYVRAIVARLAPSACIWVTPPLWKGETGIVGVEKTNAAPCRFFDSSTLPIARRKDGIHPTDQGGADWADAVWAAFFAAGEP